MSEWIYSLRSLIRVMQQGHICQGPLKLDPVFEDDFEVTFSPDCFDVGLNEGGNGAYSWSVLDLYGVDI